jgi:phospholipid/cholesterol/gamma-HCH transport system substrate-binding protein
METRARYILVGLFALIAIVAGFAFVYWLNSTGGLGKREAYQIRFQGPVSGLQTGAAVQFNGIRVGEVIALQLDRNNPGQVIATIAVAQGTPLRADTKVSVDFQGLMGTPLISLRGGSLTSPVLSSFRGQPPPLVAEATAGEDLTQTARATMLQVDKILAENRQSLKDTIDNLKTFSGALARNSNRMDGIMAGLEHLAGGGPAEKPKPVYDLTVSIPSPTSLHGQLAVAEPTAVVALDTQRILSRSSDGQISQVGDAQWSDALPKLIQAKIVESLENTGLQTVIAEPMAAATGNQLLLDLRNFSIMSGAQPTADVAFAAKIVAADGHVIGMQLFHAAVPTNAEDTPAIVASFDKAFSETVANLITWVAELLPATERRKS